jgi:hypothetical protein
MCSDCVVEMETKLRINGKYEEYEKNLLNANKNNLQPITELLLYF